MVDTDVRIDARGVALIKAKSNVNVPSLKRHLEHSRTVPDLTSYLLREGYIRVPPSKYHDFCDYRRVVSRSSSYMYDKHLYAPGYWNGNYPRRKNFSEYVYSPFYKLNYTPQPKGYWHDFNDPYYYKRYLNREYSDYMRDTFRANGSHWSAYVPSHSKNRPLQYYEWH